MTSEVDKTGHYVLAKDAVVDFVIDISAADDSWSCTDSVTRT